MENAKKDFEWIMEDYLDDMVKQGTLEQDLAEHGWKAAKKSSIVFASLLLSVIYILNGRKVIAWIL